MSNEFHSSRPPGLSADSSSEREITFKTAANVRFAVVGHNASKPAVPGHSLVGEQPRVANEFNLGSHVAKVPATVTPGSLSKNIWTA